jgi:RNA polymerase sigma-70 factor (ECF subfamily)
MDPSPADGRILDEVLVLRARAGRPDAFELLAARWQERLWRHAFRLTGREDAAWDVLQESWVAIWRGLVRLRDPGAFRRWAFTIVTRAATDRLRHAPPEAADPDALAAATARAAERGADEADGRDAAVGLVRAALAGLSREHRTLLSLHHLEGFAIWELAEILGVPAGTVKSRLHAARGALKGHLERMQRMDR